MKPSFLPTTRGVSPGLDMLICSPFASLEIPHGFTSRFRRWETTPFHEPFGMRNHYEADRQEAGQALGLGNIAYMKQVHGKQVEVIGEPPAVPPVCDALVTCREDMALVVSTADCVPILIWDSKQQVVAVVHAGWRGTAAGIVYSTVNCLQEKFDSKTASLHAALGPSIGPCCYEVGDEVVRAVTARLPNGKDLFSPGSRGRKHLDLAEANRRQLVETGVPEVQIHCSGLCTACNNELFYSYRKEGKGVGRLMGIIGISHHCQPEY